MITHHLHEARVLLRVYHPLLRDSSATRRMLQTLRINHTAQTGQGKPKLYEVFVFLFPLKWEADGFIIFVVVTYKNFCDAHCAGHSE